MTFLLNGISLPFTANENEFCEYAERKMKRVYINSTLFHFCVYKRSVDARKRNDIRFVCSVIATTNEHLSEKQIYNLEGAGFKLYSESTPEVEYGNIVLNGRPIIIGGGPAGMFCALMLAENGFCPMLIDRGGSVEQRTKAYEKFCADGVLDTENNIQFGAGGAGTFSDGKLTTRINDPRCRYVIEMLKKFGAPDDITVKAKPHIGTDILQNVVNNIYNRIEELGGTVILNCRLDSIIEMSENSICAVTSKGEINGGCLVLATGHSARDTYKMLSEKSYTLEPKPFSVGVRIEHLRDDIDKAIYGNFAGDERLGAAEYNFSDTAGRGVYTFCMCPGGQVVSGATEENGVVVNGMSERGRNGVNSNSAIAVTVKREDYGNTVEGAVNYQRNLERAAFLSANGNYYAPVQTVGDFIKGEHGHEPTKVLPSYMGGNRCTVSDLSRILPEYITSELKRGIVSFGKKLSGFDSETAVLTGVETRTSSPIRIIRNDEFTTPQCDLVYPCGEGAGYAGGITSAAVDGIRVAEKIISKYRPSENI